MHFDCRAAIAVFAGTVCGTLEVSGQLSDGVLTDDSQAKNP